MSNRVPIESLRLHPAANRVPMANDADLSALRDSLREHGQQDPLDVNADDEILDGRTRWMLLRELHAATVEVRTVHIPADQQTNYIVDRALARRHLTAEQKRALNALLREVVVEVAKHPVTGEEVLIGHGQSKRAEALGVERRTIQNWDRADGKNFPSGPTHQRVNGRIEPRQKPRPVTPSNGRANRGQKAVSRERKAPPWFRLMTTWLRHSATIDDRKWLIQMDDEVHAALAVHEIECIHQEDINDGNSSAA